MADEKSRLAEIYKAEKSYAEEHQMNCYKISLSYLTYYCTNFSISANSFIGFDYTTNQFFIDSQAFNLNGPKNLTLNSSSNPYQTTIEQMPLSILSTARLIKIKSMGTGNDIALLNQTLIYGGSLITVYNNFLDLRTQIQITVYLNGVNKLYASELFNNTFYFAVYDSGNDRVILSSVGKTSINIETSVFDFSSLPSASYGVNQAKSFSLTIDETTGTLYLVVLFKTSPLFKLRHNALSK